MFVCPLSVSGCLVCSPTTFFSFFFFFSLSLSLSQALGKPKPLAGFGVPLVLLPRGHALRLQPARPVPHLHQGHRPAPVFFFFRRPRRLVLGSCWCLFALVVWFFFFFLVVRLGLSVGCWVGGLSRFWWVAACTANALVREKGQPDYHLAPQLSP